MKKEPKRIIDALRNPTILWGLLRDYLGFARWRRPEPVNDRDSLKQFLNTRASFVGQFSLYGYLRTRSGMRYPELFDNDAFVVSINIAKWQIWLSCLSDVSVYAGGLLMQHPKATEAEVSSLIQELVTEILDEAGIPQEAGGEFAAYVGRVHKRLANCNWNNITDDEGPFSESPASLVQWAPVIDDLKQLDAEIVTNSVRFRWQKVRRDLRDLINTEMILGLVNEQK